MEGVAVLYLHPRYAPLWLAGIMTFLLIPVRHVVAGEPAAAGGEWSLISQGNDVSIYSRVHPGGDIKEYKAVGTVAASPKVIEAVLDDVDNYTHFMPYISECKVIKREGNTMFTYQRISPPFCTDRDYSIKVTHETKSSPAGPAYFTRWEVDNAQGPAEKADVLRVKINEGSWLIEPGGSNTTKATYFIYTDSGGALPGWLSAKANQIAINKLFEAIRKQAKEAKYASAG
ncbi:MAG TPA: SRPBCC family protein [Chthoniobacteraceae bacterium]|nr:SRPBCC family protein [Chthoniobacteraceae bacterium]